LACAVLLTLILAGMLSWRALRRAAWSTRRAARGFGAARPELVPREYPRLAGLFRDFEVGAGEQSAGQQVARVQPRPFEYRTSRLRGGAQVTSESADVPSYKVLLVSVRVGAVDETPATLGLTTIVKECVKMELS
jgi:hypothetical protein